MAYQKIINLLDNTPNEPTKFRTKYLVNINDCTPASIILIVKLSLKLEFKIKSKI